MEVVSVEVLECRRCGKEEVEELENEQLEGSLTFSIEEENNVLAECLVSGPGNRQNLHDFVCQRRTWGIVLIWAGIVSRAHVLLVQYELDRLAKRPLPLVSSANVPRLV